MEVDYLGRILTYIGIFVWYAYLFCKIIHTNSLYYIYTIKMILLLQNFVKNKTFLFSIAMLIT